MERSDSVMAIKNMMLNQLEEYLNRWGRPGAGTGYVGDHGEDDRQRRRNNDVVFVFKKAGVGYYPPKEVTGVDLDVIQ